MSDNKIDVLAVMDGEISTIRSLESWVNSALEGTTLAATEAVARMEAARAAVVDAIAVLEKMATHVRPTCTELYDEAVAVLARVRSS